MKIESVDFFYLSMPEVLDIGDGSQDALLVRIRAGGLEGWGECETSPLTSIASYVCPMSHSACKPIKYSLEGKHINSVEDIQKISESVHSNSFDLLQADHTLSGINIALWDLLGKKLEEPIYKLLGYKKAFPKLPYASQLFGNNPDETFAKAKHTVEAGFKAIKFGWGNFGEGTLENDIAHLEAARRGAGQDCFLMIDAGTVWENDFNEAEKRLAALKKINAYWLEEPFANLSVNEYKKLSTSLPKIPLAGGEGCNNFTQAKLMIQYGGLSFIQIDAGRVGGISPAKQVADLADEFGISYVNHSFTSHLALSASIQPYAGKEKHNICEYPIEPKQLAIDISSTKLTPGKNGYLQLPEKTGLGICVDIEAIKKYLVDIEIKLKGKNIYYTPDL
ncbi:MAG: mandelate racemase/muconate lactonizing enzyme family protein [Bacteroidetes bacterium]|nr:mandelate racemase/muconate lactonizing enzyme family protein [Bacteroidota bacterium]